MKFQKKSLLYLLPLLALLVLYGCYSVRTVRQTEQLDRAFSLLFSGELPEESLLDDLDSLSLDEFLDYSSAWSAPRQEAALLILEYNGIYFTPAPFRNGFSASHDGDGPSETDAAGAELLDLARQAAEERRFRDSESIYREYWFSFIQGSSTAPPEKLLLEIRDAVFQTNESSNWIDLLSRWEGFSSSGFGGSFFLASCYEKNGNTDEALYWYEESVLRSSQWQDTRRAQWYILRLLSRNYPSRLTAFLESSGPLRNDGDYFDDIFDEYFSTLVRFRRWGELLSIYPSVYRAGLDDTAYQAWFLLEKARSAGYIAQTALDGFDLPADPDPRGYFAVRADPLRWPYFSSEELPSGDVGTENISVHDDAKTGTAYTAELYGYLLDAGYHRQALARLRQSGEEPPVSVLIELSRYLEDRGDLYELITFAGFWFYRLPPEEGLKLLPWVYPGANRYEMSGVEGVPDELVLGIIRRESAFHEEIYSRVGAGGLMQLMPSTAEDLARRHRLEEWDLMNPMDNIMLGTLYLDWLRERPWTDSYVDVLAAYNGGGGNLRSWKRWYYSGDPDLFIQSIPFRETRDYVRKVIVAAASYRYLDTGAPPGEWLEQFYRPF